MRGFTTCGTRCSGAAPRSNDRRWRGASSPGPSTRAGSDLPSSLDNRIHDLVVERLAPFVPERPQHVEQAGHRAQQREHVAEEIAPDAAAHTDDSTGGAVDDTDAGHALADGLPAHAVLKAVIENAN